MNRATLSGSEGKSPAASFFLPSFDELAKLCFIRQRSGGNLCSGCVTSTAVRGRSLDSSSTRRDTTTPALFPHAWRSLLCHDRSRTTRRARIASLVDLALAPRAPVLTIPSTSSGCAAARGPVRSLGTFPASAIKKINAGPQKLDAQSVDLMGRKGGGKVR